MTFETCLGQNNTLFVRKRSDFHSHHVSGENFASRRVSGDVPVSFDVQVLSFFLDFIVSLFKNV